MGISIHCKVRATSGGESNNFEGLSADEIENAEKKRIKDVQSTLKRDQIPRKLKNNTV